jgi:hypothetical protein
MEQAMRNEAQLKKETLKARQEANRKKREENEKKAEVVQLVSLKPFNLVCFPVSNKINFL